jgi:phosphate/phosphite/phosphonate ABC transporter binding protein
MLDAYTPLASHLGSELQTIVELELAKDYDTLIERIASGRVDLVQLPPLAYVVAKSRAPQLDLLLTNISEGSSTYSGYILVRAGSPIRRLEDLRGKRFGFVDRNSTSGFLYAYAFFLEHGIDPEQHFRTTTFSGRHDRVIQQLLAGEIDAAASFSGALLNAESKGIATDDIEILAKTGRIPYDAWCVRGTLEPRVRERIRQVMLQLSTRTLAGRRVLAPLRSINAFAPIEDDAYDDIRRVKRMVDEATD